MALLTIDNVSLAYGTQVLFDHIHLSLQANEKVSLLGRNGAGKTTLFRLVQQQIQPDDGKIHCQDGIKIACLQQEVPEQLEGSVFDIVAAGAGEAQQLLRKYHLLTQALQQKDDPQLMDELQQVQEALEAVNGWTLVHRVEQVLSKLLLEPDERMENLSGGLKRRVMLARAILNEPDLLLLDEPTNHLDIASIIWLENFIKNYPACVLFISHDRVFTQNVAQRILELDRGHIYSWEGDYQNYLRRKQEQLHAQEMENQRFDKKLKAEEVWIRQGIKARRTRNEGRVRALKKMRQQFRERRKQIGKVRMQIDDHLHSGKIVAEIDNISYAWQETKIIDQFSTLILRGSRIGIIGPNGIGKSTLLRLLLGELQPQSGRVRLGSKLQIAWFDQLRSQLDNDKTVLENIGEGKEYITINGCQRHVYSYLQDFLFSAERARTKVGILSGGERNRLLLAKLFTQPSNLLVLDEPTNDLDSDTLELLEELLQEYQGTLILVSHDRAFLNHVITSTLVFEYNGRGFELNEYAGGYDDWLKQSPYPLQHSDLIFSGIGVLKANEHNPASGKVGKKAKTSNHAQRSKNQRKRKLSFKEKKELQNLPQQIELLEVQQQELQQQVAQPAFYQQQKQEIQKVLKQLEGLTKQLEDSYQRWEELEAIEQGQD